MHASLPHYIVISSSVHLYASPEPTRYFQNPFLTDVHLHLPPLCFCLSLLLHPEVSLIRETQHCSFCIPEHPSSGFLCPTNYTRHRNAPLK